MFLNKRNHKFLILVLVSLALGTMSWKVWGVDFDPRTVLPQRAAEIKFWFQADAGRKDVQVRTFLPQSNEHQHIQKEVSVPGKFIFTQNIDEHNRIARWNLVGGEGSQQAVFRYRALMNRVVYEIPDSLPRPHSQFEVDPRWLSATPLIQSDDSSISNLAHELGLDTLKNLNTIIRRVYTYTSKNISSTKFSGETDALLTLRLGEASCNGKSRLAVALLRNQKIPARLVGGLILNTGSKKTIHQWVEVRISEHWVPFCPLNAYLYEIPSHYLQLYIGDQTLISRTANIQFDYGFEIAHRSVSRAKTAGPAWIELWSYLQQAGINSELLSLLLMIPFGALITVLFRNMMGLTTFGTFLPALIAASFQTTGLLVGIATFSAIILLGAILRQALIGLHLLHTPRLTILLIFVILLMLGFTTLGVYFDISGLKEAGLFPIAATAITVERFALVADESGFFTSFKTFFQTLIVVTFCYLGMMSVFLQTAVMAFPEILLIVAAIALYLGRWTGMRVSEVWRFRHLLFQKGNAS